MRHLHLKASESLDFDKFEFIEQIFEFLDRLSVTIFLSVAKMSDFQSLKKSLNACFQLNPQIKYLGCYCDTLNEWESFITTNDIQQFSKSLPNLEYIRFNMYDKFYSKYNGELSHFRNVKKLSLGISDLKPENRIPLACEKLEILCIRLDEMCYDYLYDFFERHPTITTLKLVGVERNVNLLRIATALPSLKILHFCPASTPVFAEITSHLSKFQSLEVFHFYMRGSIEYDLTPLLHAGWNRIPNQDHLTDTFFVQLKR